MHTRLSLLMAPLLLGACHAGPGPTVPGDPDSREGYAGIAPDEELRFLGNEPFWGGSVRGTTLTYSTPENQKGSQVEVKRFGGRGGLGFSGALDGKSFDMTVTPGNCNDTMSDRTYPFVVMLRLGADTRQGCGWTDRTPFSGPDHP